MSDLKMPDRGDGDGQMSVRWDNGYLVIGATQDGIDTVLRCSEYNAWRILGALSMMLKVPLTKAAQKAIKF